MISPGNSFAGQNALADPKVLGAETALSMVNDELALRQARTQSRLNYRRMGALAGTAVGVVGGGLLGWNLADAINYDSSASAKTTVVETIDQRTDLSPDCKQTRKNAIMGGTTRGSVHEKYVYTKDAEGTLQMTCAANDSYAGNTDYGRDLEQVNKLIKDSVYLEVLTNKNYLVQMGCILLGTAGFITGYIRGSERGAKAFDKLVNEHSKPLLSDTEEKIKQMPLYAQVLSKDCNLPHRSLSDAFIDVTLCAIPVVGAYGLVRYFIEK